MRTIFCFLCTSCIFFAFAQENEETTSVELNYLAGNILLHAPDLGHLITGHPESVMLSVSKKTYGFEEWQKAYNYPDYGLFVLYQDFKNQYLAHNFALGAHYTFYFLNRNLSFKVAQGIAYATHPYDKENNNKNKAFGSHVLANTDFVLQYKKENVIDKFGFQAGLVFTHFSNGRIIAPNSGINTYNFNVGINYNFQKQLAYQKDTITPKINYSEPIKFSLVLRTGVDESPVIDSGQHPFYHVSFLQTNVLTEKALCNLERKFFYDIF